MPITRPRSRSTRQIAARALTAVCPLSAALLLAACGGASHQSQVASLPSHGSASSHRSASSTPSQNEGVPDPDGRPREPLNATSAQEAALYDPYLACLRAHKYVDQFTASARLAVTATCEHLEPLAAWQLDPANPQARAFIGRTVSCLQARGYHARAVLITNVPIQPPSWFIEYSPDNLNYAPSRPTVAQDTCQQDARQ
jgi:hypothetical protein